MSSASAGDPLGYLKKQVEDLSDTLKKANGTLLDAIANKADTKKIEELIAGLEKKLEKVEEKIARKEADITKERAEIARKEAEIAEQKLKALSISTIAVEGKDYPTKLLSSAEFKFEKDIPLIQLGSLDRDYLDSKTFEGVDAAILSTAGSERHMDRLCTLVKTFMAHDVREDDPGEDKLHARTRAFLELVMYFFNPRTGATLLRDGPNVGNSTSVASSGGTGRPDNVLSFAGHPPLIIVEQKKERALLSEGVRDMNKFQPTPHYDAQLIFVVGLAIAGNLMSIGRFQLDAEKVQFNEDLQLDLANTADRSRCIRVAVNIGQWLQFVHGNELTKPMEVADNSRRHIKVTKNCVYKVYKAMGAEQAKWVYELYSKHANATNRVTCLEWATRLDTPIPVSSSLASLKLRLKPVGTSRFPRSAKEMKHAMMCLLSCAADLHSKGYAHMDLRWPNVIYVETKVKDTTTAGAEIWKVEMLWYVIDCEFARPFGKPAPTLGVRDPDSQCADAAADCFMLGMMLKKVRSLLTTEEGDALIAVLMDKDRAKRSASEALKLDMFRSVQVSATEERSRRASAHAQT